MDPTPATVNILANPQPATGTSTPPTRMTASPLPHAPSNPQLQLLQHALLASDPWALTNLTQDLIGPREQQRFTSISGPDHHPLMLGTLELFCWGVYQSNIMIEECLSTLLQLHGMNPHLLISQTLLQPLLERAEVPPLWLRPTSRFYNARDSPTPLTVPIVGTLHLHQHFITVYISQDYWTISDPLYGNPTQRYPIRTWERHLHSSLNHIHTTLNLPPPTLPKFRPLPRPLSVQQDGEQGAWSYGTHAMLVALHILLGRPPPCLPPPTPSIPD